LKRVVRHAELRIEVSELKRESEDLIKELAVFLEEKTKAKVETTENEVTVKGEEEAVSRKMAKSLMIDGVTLNVDKLTSLGVKNNGYYYQLLIGLWIYNVEFQAFEFHNRFVGLWLNITGS
jgi:hypothetical protein